jgi:uncharacterized protein YidB (DUF937 family)
VSAPDDGWYCFGCKRHGHTAYDLAAENVSRKQLNPVEEARAVQAMLDEGYTLDEAAQALGCSRQLVTARAKILKLPEAGQKLVGAGEIPVSAIDDLVRRRRLAAARRGGRRDDRGRQGVRFAAGGQSGVGCRAGSA